jgi:GTP cyclohydrolase IA
VAKGNRRDGSRSNGRGQGAKGREKSGRSAVATRGARRGAVSLAGSDHPAATVVAPPLQGDSAIQLLGDGQEAEFEGLIRRQLELLGEEPDREGLLRTPQRVARSLAWLTRGYRQDARSAVGEGVFAEAHDHMVMVRDIELYSLCEHHLLPFFGKAHIAYIPAGRILGLSKLPRLVEVFARRLQVQERLTGQIADAVYEVLEPRGVGVVIEAMHLCMMMRGVEKQNSKTITSALLGSFRDDAKTRDEFLRLAHGRG